MLLFDFGFATVRIFGAHTWTYVLRCVFFLFFSGKKGFINGRFGKAVFFFFGKSTDRLPLFFNAFSSSGLRFGGVLCFMARAAGQVFAENVSREG